MLLQSGNLLPRQKYVIPGVTSLPYFNRTKEGERDLSVYYSQLQINRPKRVL